MSKKNIENKRDVLEFLWEWAEEKGNWAKLLLHEVLNTSESLSTDKLGEVYRYFRKSIGLTEDVEEIEIKKTENEFSGKSIKLKKLHKITGLNRLSSDSVIEFSPNLTVIYGDNGTGKSGFSRILKDIGYSYEKETKLLPNIYSKDPQEISAEIEYECDGMEKVFTWKPDVKQDELKDISVYNSSCVAISLSDNRNLIITPLGFDLFDRVSSELDKLTSLLENEKKSLTLIQDWFSTFHEGTVYNEMIQKIQSLSKEDIEKQSEYSEDDQKQLNNLEKEFNGMNKDLIEKEVSELNNQKSELIKLKQSIENSKLFFNEEQWNEIIETKNKIKHLKEKGYGSLEELTKEKGVDLYGKAEFEKFIKAADVYINTLPNGSNYPDSKETRCVYCNQGLSDDKSIDLLKKYKAILNDTTRQDLEKQEDKYSNLLNLLVGIPDNLQLHYPSYGMDDQKRLIQPRYLKALNDSVKKNKEVIVTNDYNDVKFSIDYDLVLSSIQEKIDEIVQIIVTKNITINDIEAEKNKLTNEINILKDKQFFTAKKKNILDLIYNYSLNSLLIQNENLFNTSSISSKTSKARKALVEQSFSETFLKELSYLRKNNIPVELNFSTKKGETNIRQRLQEQYALSDILSEGEQKAISLAEFFTELSIDNGSSTVVFDDPVNSLDHHIIDETAKRLITLSQNRQTVIFTHSVLLFNSLLHQIKLPYNKTIQNRLYHTKNNFDVCGMIVDADEEINSPKKDINHISSLLKNINKDRLEEDIAAEGYAYLRSAIELTVEHEILQGTVKRYQKNVALTNFSKLSGKDIDTYKVALNDIFEKCCEYIKAHSKATPIVSTSNINQLKIDFEEYQKIRKVFV